MADSWEQDFPVLHVWEQTAGSSLFVPGLEHRPLNPEALRTGVSNVAIYFGCHDVGEDKRSPSGFCQTVRGCHEIG